MKQEKRVPKRRFRAFAETGEWNSVTLSDIADVVGGGTPDTENTDYWDGDIDWYTPSEIGAHAYADGSIRKISAAGLANSSAQMLPAGKTVLFTSRASIGDSAILQSEGTTNQGFQSLVTKDDVDPYFLYSLTGIIKNYALQQAAGSTFIEVSGKNLGQCPLVIPSPNEQQSIGEFCRQLDDIISLHECKLQKLEHLKQAYLAEMFPAKGERQPRRRFKEFSGNWKQCKYGDVISLQSGQDFPPDGYNDNGIGIPYMTGASCIIDGKTIAERWTQEPRCLAYQGETLLVCKGSGYGTLATLMQPKAHIARQFMALRCTEQLDIRFNFHLAENVVEEIKRDARGLIAGLDRNAVLDQRILLPSIEEQQKVGAFLDNCSEGILKKKRKLAKLRALKQAYLSELFV